jgi:hypothetical protein
LRISDFGLIVDSVIRELLVQSGNQSAIRNPQSAIRNPQSEILASP